MNLIEIGGLAAWVALKPMSYVMRLVIAGTAFGAAMNVENTVTRLLGFVFLLLSGAGFLFVGLGNGTVVDIALGLCGLGAAGYSWWFTRA